MSINKNVTYPKKLKCPTCHVVSDSDVEYWMQDYNFPSWVIEQCNNPKCENHCGDFKVNLKVAITVAEGWIPVTFFAVDNQTTPGERKKALVMLAWSNARKQGVELCPECLRATEWRNCIDCEGAGDELDEDCDLCDGNGGHNVCRCGWNDEK